jgi:hypothetical protein
MWRLIGLTLASVFGTVLKFWAETELATETRQSKQANKKRRK